MTALAQRRLERRPVSPVVAFLGRRFLAAIAALLAASVLIFAGAEVLPGNAASAVLGRDATPQAVRILSKQLGLGRSPVTRYFDWLGGFVHGDLGVSSVALAQGQRTKVS